jgi:hypothetical protein
MEAEIKAVEAAFEEIVTHLRKQADDYLKDIREGDESYRGIKKDDALIWLIESF